jgi:anti-sigma factor RsiW
MSDRQFMKRYLLGRLSPDEQIALENRYAANSAEFEELTEVENDLIDSYARGTIPAADKDEFEKRYLGSERQRARTHFARALAEISRESDPMESVKMPSVWERFVKMWTQPHLLRPQWAAVAGIVALVLAFGSYHWVHNRDLQAEMRLPKAAPGAAVQPPAIAHPGPASSKPPQAEDSSEAEIARNEAAPLNEFTMRLSPGVQRGGTAKANDFIVPPQASRLKFQLSLDNDDHTRYAAEIETADGTKVERVEALGKESVRGRQSVIMRIPSSLIPAGDYVIKLVGIGQATGTEEEVEVYSFRALTK